MVGFDDWKEKVAEDALQNRHYVTVDTMILESGL